MNSKSTLHLPRDKGPSPEVMGILNAKWNEGATKPVLFQFMRTNFPGCSDEQLEECWVKGEGVPEKMFDIFVEAYVQLID